jgi:anti-sigma factor RsiW
MNCADFEHWLDGGQPETERAAAEAHARDCRACAAALAAASEIEALLAGQSIEAPPSFTDEIMRRVAAEPPRRADLAGSLAEPALPWWIQSLAQPETVLAAALGAITIGLAPRLVALAEPLFLRATAFTATVSPPSLPAVSPLPMNLAAGVSFPEMLAFGILIGGGVALAGWALYRWGSALFTAPRFARASGAGLSGSPRTH